jgi:hypothetical protein
MINYEENFFLKMDRIISTMQIEDQDKMEFAKQFLNRMGVLDIEGGRILLDPMDAKTFMYFIYSLILEYDSQKQYSKG